jgi:hypothetical protein
VISDGVGEEVGVTLIHHFVGVMVGVVDMGVTIVSSADTIPPRREALPKSRKSRQEKRIMKPDITRNFLIKWVVEEFGWVAKKIGDVLFHDWYFTSHIARVPLQVSTSKASASPKNAFVLQSILLV